MSNPTRPHGTPSRRPPNEASAEPFFFGDSTIGGGNFAWSFENRQIFDFFFDETWTLRFDFREGRRFTARDEPRASFFAISRVVHGVRGDFFDFRVSRRVFRRT